MSDMGGKANGTVVLHIMIDKASCVLFSTVSAHFQNPSGTSSVFHTLVITCSLNELHITLIYPRQHSQKHFRTLYLQERWTKWGISHLPHLPRMWR